jgi:hypothetical protein
MRCGGQEEPAGNVAEVHVARGDLAADAALWQGILVQIVRLVYLG